MTPIRLGRVVIDYRDGDLQTTLPDGTVTHAQAHDTPEYAQTAARLGYDTAEHMNRDHDLVHSLIAHWLHLPYSPTLARAAWGEKSNTLTNIEEDAVLALQRLANALSLDLMEIARETGAQANDFS